MITEIEIPGKSLSLKCWTAHIDDIPAFFKKLETEADTFKIDPDTPGFHDCATGENVIRGFYSAVTPFEVEQLVDGITTKTLHKRIDSTEFILTENRLFTWDKGGPARSLTNVLSALSGYGVSTMEFERSQMRLLESKLSQVQKIDLTNPKGEEIRRAKLAGLIEHYESCGVVEPGNHGIESVSGLADTPLGPVALTVTRKGGLKFGVKRGFTLTLDCLEWVLGLLKEE